MAINEVVILVKDNHFGCISAIKYGDDLVIMKYDSRQPEIGINKFSFDAGLAAFNQAVKLSTQRDWQVVYSGQPLWG